MFTTVRSKQHWSVHFLTRESNVRSQLHSSVDSSEHTKNKNSDALHSAAGSAPTASQPDSGTFKESFSICGFPVKTRKKLSWVFSHFVCLDGN